MFYKTLNEIEILGAELLKTSSSLSPRRLEVSSDAKRMSARLARPVL